MSKRGIKPLGSWILVEIVERDVNRLPGLLVIPEGNHSDAVGFSKARVLAVGTGHLKYKPFASARIQLKRKVPLGINEGDFVYFRTHLHQANPTSIVDLEDNRFLLHSHDVEVLVVPGGSDVTEDQNCPDSGP